MVDRFPAPIQEITTDERTKRFPLVWIRWFEQITDIITDLQSGGVTSVNGATGVVTLDAGDIAYDNSTSGLTATNVQAAIDEVSKEYNFRQISAIYTPIASDQVIEVTANSFIITLPTAVAVTGKYYDIKNNGAGAVTVAAAAMELVEGGADVPLSSGDSMRVISNGTGWLII
jgi:hypothetical protein